MVQKRYIYLFLSVVLVLTASVLLIQTQSNTPLTEKFQPIYSNSGITGAAIGLPQEFIETPTQDESQNTENTTTTNQTTSPPELIEEKNTLQENDSENSNQNNSSNDNSTSQQVEQQQTKTQESTTNQQESNSNTKEETVSKTTSTQSTTALFQAAEVSDINETTIEWIYPTSNINVSQHELFNVTVNVTCTSGYCGEINVTLDPESTVYNFSTCTASGRNGPSQANCDTAYSGEELDGLVTVGDGIQNWTVPSSGTYTITAQGASGVQGGSGSGNGGHGTLMKGDFVLTEGDVISVLVGQLGTRDGTYGGGGGGGTFVIDSTNDDILMIAGGGGGASIRSSTYTDGRDATTSISGTNGSLDSVLDSNAPGTDGNGGSTSSNGGGAGAGYSGDGADYQSGSGGHSYLNGAQGGDSSSGSSFGGFGGAGAGYGGGGGGGGYNGGGAGGYAGSGGGGGGGGSVNNGTNQNNTVGTVEQHGYVLIELANSLKDGTIPMETNATPFYTITTNPYNITLNESESEIITWWVNATGDIDIAHEFFIYTNRTSDGLASNNTTKLNITIIDTTTPQITILYPQNTTYNSQVTELNYSYNDLNGNGVCWYSLDQGATNSSTTSTPTNISDFSANNGGNDLTLYCNDSSSNFAQAQVSFTQNIPELSLEILTSTANQSRTYHEFFDIQVRVTCNVADCGEINVSLDPIPELDKALWPQEEEKPEDSEKKGFLTGGNVGIQSTISLYDNKSFQYDIEDGCDIIDGQSDVFDRGLQLFINNSEYTGTRSSTEDDGREAVCDAQTKSNMNVSRQVYVPNDQNWARYLEILHNPQNYTVCVNVRNSQNMGSDGSDFMNTSDGDNTWELTDNWMMWDDTNPTAGDDAAGFIYQEDGTSEPVDVITPTTASGGTNAFTWENVCVPAGDTKILMHFFTQWDTRAQSEAEADVILANYLDDIYVGNMTSTEKANVVNWELGSEKGGLISTTIGDTPFYTNYSENPTNISLSQGESQTITFSVNATGTINTTHTFFAFVNKTSNTDISNESVHWNVTITDGNASVEEESSPDTTTPYFSDIPNNQSINFQSTFAGIQFNGTDETAVNNYSINDSTYFSINSSGFLQNTTALGAATYTLNVTVNDTSNNTNSTLWQITVNKIEPTLNLTINQSQDNINLTQNTTIPINATAINADQIAIINLYNNFTLINSASTTTNQISNNTNFTTLGYHNITFEYLESENFTNKNISYYVNVSEAPSEEESIDNRSAPSISFISPTPNNNANSTQNTTINVSTTETNNQDHYAFVDFNKTLVGWYRLDNDTTIGENSTLVVDQSNSSVSTNATVMSGAQENITGAFNGSYQFDGTTNAYLDIASNLGLTNKNVTISTWAYLPTASEKGPFVKVGADGSGSGYGIGVGASTYDDNGNDILIIFENRRWIDTNTNIGTGWHHLALTLDDESTPRVYLDGSLVGTYPGTVPITPADEIHIGGYSFGGADRYFSHNIDEVLLFNRTLELSEIQSLYNATLYQFDTRYDNLTINNSYEYQAFTVDSTGALNQTELRTFFVNETSSTAEEVSDTTTPYFSDIPNNQSINFQSTFAGIQFNGTDDVAVQNYTINDSTYFTINASGFLINTTALGAATYTLNITVNDTSNNTNSTLWQITVNKIEPTLNLTINQSQASITNLTQNTTIPINATIINADQVANINLYNNFTLINSASTTTTNQISNNTNFTTLGYHNITFEYLESENFTSKNISFFVNVTTPSNESEESEPADSTYPEVTINSPTSRNYTVSSVTFNVTISENGTAWFSLDNGITNVSMTGDETNGVSANNQEFGTEFNYTNGSLNSAVYTVTFYANDTSGNLNNTESMIFEVYTTDVDGDGELDRNDTLIGNESDVGGWGGITNMNITVGGNRTNGTFQGRQEIQIQDNNTLLVNFSHNFTSSILNLSRITINQNASGMWVNLSDQLQNDTNKTLYVIDYNFTSLCAKDAELSSLSEISTTCTGASETNITSCIGNNTGVTIGNITCTDLNGTYKVENLRYSGILGISPSSESEEESEESSPSPSGGSSGGGGSGSSSGSSSSPTTSEQTGSEPTSDESTTSASAEESTTGEDTSNAQNKDSTDDQTQEESTINQEQSNQQAQALSGMALNLGNTGKQLANSMQNMWNQHSTKLLSLGAILITTITFVGLISKHEFEHVAIAGRKFFTKNRKDEDEKEQQVEEAMQSQIFQEQSKKPTWMLLKEELEELKRQELKQKQEFLLQKQKELQNLEERKSQERLQRRYNQLHEKNPMPQKELSPEDKLKWIEDQLQKLK